MRNILVTGAGGFIGSHLTELLVEKGIMSKHLYIIIPGINGVGWIQALLKTASKLLPGIYAITILCLQP